MYKKSILSYKRQFAISLLLLLTACSSLKAPGKQEKVQPTLTSSAEVNPSVSVHDQNSDGTSVIVADVVSQGSGWMAIHNQVNGKLGDPIGETQLNPGDNKNIVVKIDPARATPVMYAMLHEDAGTVRMGLTRLPTSVRLSIIIPMMLILETPTDKELTGCGF